MPVSGDRGLVVEPGCGKWADLVSAPRVGELGGVPLDEWRRRMRQEIGLPTDRPVIATGHQTLLWHPGILVKYLAVEAMCGGGPAAAQLIVDQHVGGFAAFDVPVLGRDGALEASTVTLAPTYDEVPMLMHPAFEPARVEIPDSIASVRDGVRRIMAAVSAHAGATNAARQMAGALSDLMAPWVSRWPGVCSSDLMATALAEAVLMEMADDPQRCIAAYNAAVESRPGTAIATLSAEQGELPVWKIEPYGRRSRADVDDVRRWLAEREERLLPRALLLTLLVRLGMCDLFVHGTGGAAYDRVMERWAGQWLNVEPSPKAVVTATMRLPLPDGEPLAPNAARARARSVWHDPEDVSDQGPGPIKRRLLASVDAAPRRSRERFEAFRSMHERIEVLRGEHRDLVEQARRRAELAERNHPIASRRDWAFPLYPTEMIDELAQEVAHCVSEK